MPGAPKPTVSKIRSREQVQQPETPVFSPLAVSEPFVVTQEPLTTPTTNRR